MSITFRHYTDQAGITEDYLKVRSFLVDLGYSEFTYARWDWMATHSYLDQSAVGKIGIWEKDGKVIGLATFDTTLGTAYCLTYPEHCLLKQEMLSYAYHKLNKGKKFGIAIRNTDVDFQDIAAGMGFGPTVEREDDAVFYINKTPVTYQLPDGFHITSLKETYDLYEYRRVLWKGFNHEINGEGEFVYTKETERSAEAEMKHPFVDLSKKVAVVAPDGHFVSYCGMWYEPKAGFAVIEPVATDPDFRRMGLGKAAVIEGIKRTGELGAKIAFVGSSQQFYYSIGLRPYASSTVWVKRFG